MSTASEGLQSGWTEQPPPIVQWRVWPMRDRLHVGAGGVLALVAAGVLVQFLAGSTPLALAAGAALAVAAWRFFLPVRYELNTDGVNRWLFGRHRCIPWNEIRNYHADDDGVLFLPFKQPCSLDAARGFYLPWGLHAEPVLDQIHYYLDPIENE